MGNAAWEGYDANVLQRSGTVRCYAKTDHPDFQIFYVWNGSRRIYVPDFMVSDHHCYTLVLEIKGQKSPQNDAKHAAFEEWIAAINGDQGFGKWSWAVAYKPVEVDDIVANL